MRLAVELRTGGQALAFEFCVATADVESVSSERQALKISMLRVAPFAGACCLAWIAVLIGSTVTWWEYCVSLGVVLLAGAIASIALVTRRLPWLAVVPSAMLLLTAIGLLRDSAGGFSSGVSALAILPVFQTALYSRSRRDLGIVLAALALFFLIPIWVVGPPAYPDTQYRTVVLAVAVDAIIGLTTQALVARVRDQVREARAREHVLEQVAAVVQGLLESPGPRQDVCEAVMTISGATAALLFEPLEGSNQLACTATAGIAQVDDGLVPRRSSAYDAMRTGQPVLITENVEAHIGLIDAWIAAGRPQSLLYQPLLRGSITRGVLVIGWPDRVPAHGAGTTVVTLLAHEIAAVISRADTLDHLSDQALTDALTGLPNRRAWDRHLRQLASTRQQFAVAILDLDHFKQFNDTHGHPAGDRLLKETAAAWRDQLRAGDVLTRVGGEEFGLLLLDCDAPTAQEVVNRLRDRVAHGRTCSAGIAVQEHAEPPEAAVQRADAALYQAKASGRDQTQLALTADGGSAYRES